MDKRLLYPHQDARHGTVEHGGCLRWSPSLGALQLRRRRDKASASSFLVVASIDLGDDPCESSPSRSTLFLVFDLSRLLHFPTSATTTCSHDKFLPLLRLPVRTSSLRPHRLDQSSRRIKPRAGPTSDVTSPPRTPAPTMPRKAPFPMPSHTGKERPVSRDVGAHCFLTPWMAQRVLSHPHRNSTVPWKDTYLLRCQEQKHGVDASQYWTAQNVLGESPVPTTRNQLFLEAHTVNSDFATVHGCSPCLDGRLTWEGYSTL
jgi:hypothetical protein